MTPDTVFFFIILMGLTAVMTAAGRKIIFGELKETEDESTCRKGKTLWTILCLSGFIVVSVLYILLGNSVPSERLLFLFYVYQYSTFISLVDSFSHNFYLEMLPGLFVFIPVGCFTWGVPDAVCGMLAGISLGFIYAAIEWFALRKLSYGGGDAVYAAAASCLIGYSNILCYCVLLTALLVIAGAVHIFYVKAVRKQTIMENRFVPLLPWISLLTTCIYGFSIYPPMQGILF